MTLEDLAEHQSQWVKPISIQYREVRLHEIPPNAQGLAAQIALGILGHTPATDPGTLDGALQLAVLAFERKLGGAALPTERSRTSTPWSAATPP